MEINCLRENLKLSISFYMFIVPAYFMINSYFNEYILKENYLYLMIPELLFYTIDLFLILISNFDIKMVSHHIVGYGLNYLLYIYINRPYVISFLYKGFFLEQGCATFTNYFLKYKDSLLLEKKDIYKLYLKRITYLINFLKIIFFYQLFTSLKIILNENFLYIANVFILLQIVWNINSLPKIIKKEICLFLRVILFISYALFNIITHVGTILDYKIMLFIMNNKITSNKKCYHEKGVIFMSNHYTALDNWVIKSLVNDNTYSIFKSDLITQRKDKSLVVKILSYLENKFFYAAKGLKYKRNDRESGILIKKKILEKIKNNNNIIIYPEGTSTKNGVSKQFKEGIFHLAAENKIPIIPITIHYSHNIGIEVGDKFILSNWFNIETKIIFHEKIKNNNYLELKNEVFNTIINCKNQFK